MAHRALPSTVPTTIPGEPIILLPLTCLRASFILLFVFSFAFSPRLSATPSAAPVLFYSDIDSGPRSGGEGGQDGAFICIYGEQFGSGRAASFISIGGTQVVNYKLWTDPGEPYRPGHYAKACAQISHATPDGKSMVELTTAQGKSNSLPFTIRGGKVFFVAPHGGDLTGNGSDQHPWQTIKHCKSRMSAGDICYVRDGLKVTTNEAYGTAVVLDSSGEPGKPRALVAYPGASVIVDNASTLGALRALTNYDRFGDISYWTVAGLSFNSAHVSFQLLRGNGIRVVDNDVQCTGSYCYGYDAGLLVGGPGATTTGITILGNRVHDVGCGEDSDYHSSVHPCNWFPVARITMSTSGSTWRITQWPGSFGPGYVIEANGELRRIDSCDSGCRSGKLDAAFSKDLPEGTAWKFRFPSPPKFFHSVYLGNANSIEFAWNDVDGKRGQACRGVLFHSTASHDMYDVHVHDNAIHDTVCDCVAFGTVDPNQGPVEAYNNTLYRCGLGSTMVQMSSFSGVYLSNDADCLPNASRGGRVQVFNNTIYNAGSGGVSGNNNSCFAVKVVTTPAHGSAGLDLKNNACIQAGTNRQTYVTTSGADTISRRPLSSYVAGTHNDCYGSDGSCPSELSDSVNVPAGFADAKTDNFRLASDSKLKGAGAPSKATTDQDGKPRGSRPNIGAF